MNEQDIYCLSKLNGMNTEMTWNTWRRPSRETSYHAVEESLA